MPMPGIIITRPRSTMPTASVISTSVNAGWPSSGRSRKRSMPYPSAAVPVNANTKASQNGKARGPIAISATKPPTIISSPCTKLTVSVAL